MKLRDLYRLSNGFEVHPLVRENIQKIAIASSAQVSSSSLRKLFFSGLYRYYSWLCYTTANRYRKTAKTSEGNKEISSV